MDTIYGKDFMLYIECETLDGSVMIPMCIAKGVQLQLNSDISEATKGPSSKDKSFYYGRNSYTLSLDGLITYSKSEISQQIVEVQGKLLEAGNKLVSIGGTPVNQSGAYFCLENALMDWKILKWVFEGTTTPIKWAGSALVQSLSNSFQADGLAEFTGNLQVTGGIQRFHTPAPTNLRKESQTDTIPTENATFVENGSDTQTGAWNQRFLASGTSLPGGKFHIAIYGDSIDHIVEPGDTLEEIVQDLANQINAKQYVPDFPPPDVVTASADDDTLTILFDEQHSAVSSYVNHTGILKSLTLLYDCEIDYSFYRLKVIQGLNTWYIDVQTKNPTIILPPGTYDMAVSGMGADLQYSDYSETKTITIN